MKKSTGESILEQTKEENVVSYCKNCFGLEPCLCDKKEYVKTWDFVYWVFKKCKM